MSRPTIPIKAVSYDPTTNSIVFEFYGRPPANAEIVHIRDDGVEEPLPTSFHPDGKASAPFQGWSAYCMATD